MRPASFDVLGIPISMTDPQRACALLLAWTRDQAGRFVCIRDMHGVMLARRDTELSAIHRRAAMVTPDGMPLALIGKLRGLDVERTCGPDLMLKLFDEGRAAGLRHYLYGGREGIAAELGQAMRHHYPGAIIVAEETPPFHSLDDGALTDLAARIDSQEADIVWIGLSTPKQERLMDRLAPLVRSTLVGVGAAFDIHSGHVGRAPHWMQRLCLEGVYRLLREPRRLWRRYLVLGPQFLVLAGMQQVRLGKRRAAQPKG